MLCESPLDSKAVCRERGRALAASLWEDLGTKPPSLPHTGVSNFTREITCSFIQNLKKNLYHLGNKVLGNWCVYVKRYCHRRTMPRGMEGRIVPSPRALGRLSGRRSKMSARWTLCQVCFNRERAKNYSSFTGCPWWKIFAFKI